MTKKSPARHNRSILGALLAPAAGVIGDAIARGLEGTLAPKPKEEIQPQETYLTLPDVAANLKSQVKANWGLSNDDELTIEDFENHWNR